MTRSGLIVLLGLSMLFSSVALADYRSGRHDEHYRSHSNERYGESHHSRRHAYRSYRRPSVTPYWRYGYTPRGPVITYRPYAYRSNPYYAYPYRSYPYRAYPHRAYPHRYRDYDYDD